MQTDLPGFDSSTERTLRNVFFALRPRGAVLDSIIAAGDAIVDIHPSVGRRLKRHRLHMTLLYLDTLPAIPASYLHDAIAAGDQIAASPFDLVLDVAGSFKNGDLPWWLGCASVPDALTTLHRRLYTDVRQRGPKPRGGVSLTPHVTISRANSDALPHTSIAPIRWRVDEVCLIESVFGKREFDIVKTWTLRDPSHG